MLVEYLCYGTVFLYLRIKVERFSFWRITEFHKTKKYMYKYLNPLPSCTI